MVAEHGLCFVERVECDVDERLQTALFIDRLARAGAALKSIEYHAAGCYIVISAAHFGQLQSVVRASNVAIRSWNNCGKISLKRERSTKHTMVLADVIAALEQSSIRVVHGGVDAAGLAVLVAGDQIQSAMRILTGGSAAELAVIRT